VNPVEQAEHYNEIAEFWSNANFKGENGIAQHQRALQFAKKSGCAIDIGCGSNSRILDLLQQQGFDVEGLDFSIEMLNIARIAKPHITFHHANIYDWEFHKKYAFISAWDSIWHVPLNQQEAVIQKLCAALAEDGVLIFSSGAVDEAGDSVSLFLGKKLYHAALGVSKLLNILNTCDCVCRHLENDDWPGKHLYIIAQKKSLMPHKDKQPMLVSR
jgi:2-polyprenyl-3-methyl-5-hydroxy-6-metoxy-1,4-benzoquinol methylase